MVERHINQPVVGKHQAPRTAPPTIEVKIGLAPAAAMPIRQSFFVIAEMAAAQHITRCGLAQIIAWLPAAPLGFTLVDVIVRKPARIAQGFDRFDEPIHLFQAHQRGEVPQLLIVGSAVKARS